MKPAARRFDNTECKEHASGLGVVLPLGGPDVFVNGQPAVRLADEARCLGGGADAVSQGAAMVRIGGLPAAAQSHATVHGSSIITGSKDVNIGGTVFALPKGLHIGGDAAYRNKVIRDLWLLSQTDWGKEMLARLEQTGKEVTIRPGREHGAVEGVVYYDPDLLLRTEGRAGGVVNAPPQTALAHELAHAVRIAEGKAPQIPRDERQKNAEEERVRGDATRPYEESISENALRRELGIPERGPGIIPEGYDGPVEGPDNLRPGGY